MTSERSSDRRTSRRRLLGGGAALGAAALGGCLEGVLGSSRQSIDPETPSDPRKGTPGEFYALVERNDIPVDGLYREGDELTLVYRSSADDEDASQKEIEMILTVFNENLVKNDADVAMLYAEVANPFDGQAHGWGCKTEWCERYNAGELSASLLVSNVLNSRVYEEDVEG